MVVCGNSSQSTLPYSFNNLRPLLPSSLVYHLTSLLIVHTPSYFLLCNLIMLVWFPFHLIWYFNSSSFKLLLTMIHLPSLPQSLDDSTLKINGLDLGMRRNICLHHLFITSNHFSSPQYAFQTPVTILVHFPNLYILPSISCHLHALCFLGTHGFSPVCSSTQLCPVLKRILTNANHHNHHHFLYACWQ